VKGILRDLQRETLRNDPWHTHTAKSEGVWVRGSAIERTRLTIQHNGVHTIKLVCVDCDKITGPIPQTVADAWGLRIDETRDHREADVTCCYRGCLSLDVEWHHFAPQNTFGDDAGNWPIQPLCRAHHRQWHATMDGYSVQRAGQWTRVEPEAVIS
jgi:hypothetical protein